MHLCTALISKRLEQTRKKCSTMLGMKTTILALVPSLGTVHGLHVWAGVGGLAPLT